MEYAIWLVIQGGKKKGVFITDSDALDRIKQVEGEEWAKKQLDDTGFSFTSFLREFNSQNKELTYSGNLLVGGNVAIYGDGGFNRYFVSGETGEIFLSRAHASAQSLNRAAQERISIWG